MNVEEHHDALADHTTPPRKREYRNISELYGDDVPVCLEDYLDLNPDGVFEVRPDGIYEAQDGYNELIAEPIEDENP